jgi:hypothetical protein
MFEHVYRNNWRRDVQNEGVVGVEQTFGDSWIQLVLRVKVIVPAPACKEFSDLCSLIVLTRAVN